MVSVIVVSYNTKELLRLCLASIHDKLKNIPFEIIVVDNASEDETIAMVEKNFPSTKIIRNKTNYGFAKGINIGVKQSVGEYLLFLNSDAQLKNDTINDMVFLFKENKQLGVVGGLLETTNGVTSESHGSFSTIQMIITLLFGRAFNKSEKISKNSMVDWVSGGFMLVRSSVFKELKGFDEHFFMYVEDMEFCYRVKKEGYTVQFFPRAIATHAGQGSSNRSFAIVNIYKGLLYFYRKHKTYSEYIAVKILLTSKAIIAIIIGIVTSNKEMKKTYQQAIAFAI